MTEEQILSGKWLYTELSEAFKLKQRVEAKSDNAFVDAVLFIGNKDEENRIQSLLISLLDKRMQEIESIINNESGQANTTGDNTKEWREYDYQRTQTRNALDRGIEWINKHGNKGKELITLKDIATNLTESDFGKFRNMGKLGITILKEVFEANGLKMRQY